MPLLAASVSVSPSQMLGPGAPGLLVVMEVIVGVVSTTAKIDSTAEEQPFKVTTTE